MSPPPPRKITLNDPPQYTPIIPSCRQLSLNDQKEVPMLPSSQEFTLTDQQQATLRQFLRLIVLKLDLMSDPSFRTEALACSPPLDAEDRKKVAALVGIDLSLLPPKTPGRLALCQALIIADKDDVMRKIGSATPMGKDSFKDPDAFFRYVRMELAPPQDPTSYKLWESHIQSLYDSVHELLISGLLQMVLENVVLRQAREVFVYLSLFMT